MFFGRSIAIDSEEIGQVALSDSSGSATDRAFIDNLRAGDAAAFDQLVLMYSGDIYSLLYRLTEDPEEASDLTQDTFLRALRAIHGFRGDAGLKTWLYRIAINESRNRWRWWKRRNRSATISLDVESDQGVSIADRISDPAEGPEQATLRREREYALRRELSELPRNYKEVVILRDIEGLTYEEIAAALNTNIGTVKSRIARGREELRKRLKDF